jgi:tRNA/rRNA methyltransferase
LPQEQPREQPPPHYNGSLLAPAQRDHLKIVLVSPRNPLNIGAAARAMANFGFTRLTVVAPYEPHWREAQSAVGAEELLQNAKRTESLAEAVADCTLVIGTGTLAHRKAEQPVVTLPNLAAFIQNKGVLGTRVALVFGPEKRGLTREDLGFCHGLAVIPTHPAQPSMNLGQAVAVCLYELAARNPIGEDASGSAGNEDVFATALQVSSGELDRLAEVIETMMFAAGYSPAEMRSANRHDLRLLLRRLALNQPDARRAMGLFRKALHKMKG